MTSHKGTSTNVNSLERRVDSGLGNVHTRLAAITPRAAAERTPPDPA